MNRRPGIIADRARLPAAIRRREAVTGEFTNMADYGKMKKEALIRRVNSLLSSLDALEGRGIEKPKRLIQELQVHQIELEIQNRELRKAQERLEEANSRYADLYDFSPVGYVGLDEKGIIREINLTGSSMLGIERSRLIGKPFVLYLDGADRTTFEEHLRHCRSAKERTVSELAISAGREDPVEIEMMSAPFENHEKKAILRSALIDVTERRKAEKRLRQLSSAMEQSPSMVMVFDTKGRIEHVNARFTEITGYCEDEVIGLYPGFLSSGDHSIEFYKGVLNAVLSGRTWRGDLCGKKKNGELFRRLASIMPVRGRKKAVTDIVAVEIDDTERKAAEKKLLEEKQFFEGLVESLPGIFYSFDRSGKFISWNRNLEKVTGYSAEEISSLNHLDFFETPEEKGLIARKIEECLKKGHAESETPLLTKDGVKIPYHYTGSVVTIDDKPYIIGMGFDITELKKSEEELRRAKDKLEFRVRERTASLLAVNTALQTEVRERRRAEERVLRLNRLYSILSRINEAIVRVSTPLELYEKACRIAIEEGLFRMAWVGLVDPATSMIKPVAHFGAEEGYLEGLKVSMADIPSGRGPTGAAVREGMRFICDDFTTDPGTAPWREEALKRGYRSSAAFPLKVSTRVGKKVVGAFTLYAGEPNFFDAERVELLDSLAADLSFAIESMENREEKKAAEAELARHRESLEEIIEERTAALTATNRLLSLEVRERKRAEEEAGNLNEELKSNVSRLETINTELEAFDYSLAHDLSATLRIIDGFSAMFLKYYHDRVDAEGRQFLDTIRGNARKMGRLIQDLLDIARLSRRDVRFEEIDMARLASDVFRELDTAGRDVRFKVRDLPAARGEFTLIRQVLTNLFSNSVKYTRPRKTALIEMGGKTSGEENSYYVKDNGVGFDMEHSGRLFGVFKRLHSESEFEGTGAGLAIVQRIISRHGGRVWAEGSVGHGATFHFTLPAGTAGETKGSAGKKAAALKRGEKRLS